jgi:hypothetical protein
MFLHLPIAMHFSLLFKEKERQRYDTEIEKLQKELEDVRKKGPSDQQLALKRRLDEQCERKGILLPKRAAVQKRKSHAHFICGIIPYLF